MLDAICPACGRGGSIPRDRVNTRLVCKKCFQVFHVTASGSAVKGEPLSLSVGAAPKPKTKEAKPKREREEGEPIELGRVSGPFKVLAGVLVGILLGWFGYPLVFPGPESLEQRSIRAAQAILDANDSKLQGFVTAGFDSEVKSWTGQVRPKLEEYRKRWPGHDLNVTALVVNESRGTGKASVIAYFSPPNVASRTGSGSGDAIVDSTGKGEPLAIPLNWVLDRSDSWRIDPRESAKSTIQ